MWSTDEEKKKPKRLRYLYIRSLKSKYLSGMQRQKARTGEKRRRRTSRRKKKRGCVGNEEERGEKNNKKKMRGRKNARQEGLKEG